MCLLRCGEIVLPSGPVLTVLAETTAIGDEISSYKGCLNPVRATNRHTLGAL